MKIAIITSISGSNELLTHPLLDSTEIKYYAFVDSPYSNYNNSNGWNLKPIPSSTFFTDFRGRRCAKQAKVLGPFLLPGFDAYIWQDPYCQVKSSFIDLLYKCQNSDYDFFTFNHRFRQQVYQEFYALFQTNKENKYRLIRYYVELLKRNHLKLNLCELTSFAYFNTYHSRKLLLLWWEDICRFTSRDQISFPSALMESSAHLFTLKGFANGREFTTGGQSNIYCPQIIEHTN